MLTDEKYIEATKKAMIMSQMLIEIEMTKRKGDVYGHGYDPLVSGFEVRLRDAMGHLLHPDKDIAVYGAACVEGLWNEVPHLHVRLT